MKKWYKPEYDFTFYFTTKVEEIKNPKVLYRFLNDLHSPNTPIPAAICHMDDDEQGAYILLVNTEDTLPELVDNIAHEVCHAMGFLYKAIGEETRISEVTEINAYLQGWLVGEIVRALGYE